MVALPEPSCWLANAILMTLREWLQAVRPATRLSLGSEDLDCLEKMAAQLAAAHKDTRAWLARNSIPVEEYPLQVDSHIGNPQEEP